MAALIPISKQTKKSRKLFYRKYRGDWQGVSPATRVMQSKKIYSRKREKQNDGKEFLIDAAE